MAGPSILIAGAGPTGLAAALFLADGAGWHPRIVDASTGPSMHSKALAVNPRTLHLLEGTGVVEGLLESGLPVRAFNLWQESQRLARLRLSRPGLRHPFMLLVPQAETEARLERALARRGIPVEWGTRLEEFEITGTPRGSRVLWRLAGPADEGGETDFLLGADGASSTTRKILGIPFDGTSYEEPWFLQDLELDTPLEPLEGHAFLLRRGFLVVLPMKGGLWRVVGDAPDPASRLPLGSVPGREAWASRFTISHRVARTFARGPVFLAGDAAHIHSPFGARGLNLGIEDAWSFARLAAQGGLDRYDALRRPVDTAVVRRIARITEIPRGRSAPARILRHLAPLLGALFPLLEPWIARQALGLDHPLTPRPRAAGS